MAMQDVDTQKDAAVFGRANDRSANLEAQRVRRILQRRLNEKIRNYDRIASRLELRGEKDAAEVLQRAAGQLRALTTDVE